VVLAHLDREMQEVALDRLVLLVNTLAVAVVGLVLLEAMVTQATTEVLEELGLHLR
jgi:hypothetical protein